MDSQTFLVRPPLSSGRPVRGVTKILKFLEYGITLSSLQASSSQNAAIYRFEHIVKALPSPEDASELTLDILNSNGKGYDTLRLSCDSRMALLTALHNRLDDANGIGMDFSLKKHSTQRGGLVDTVLRVRSASIVKMVNTGVRHERRKVNPTKKLNFQNILKMETLIDDEHVVLLYFKSRAMRLSMKDSSPFLQAIQWNMKTYLGREIDIRKITTPVMIGNISSYVKKLKESQILCEFEAIKRLGANKQERNRLISITAEDFIERCDDEVIGIHSLSDILGLIISENSTREVILEFRSWRPTLYLIEARDDFVASIVNIMDSTKRCSLNIQLESFLGYRFPEKIHPIYQSECESYYISQLLATDNGSLDQTTLQQVLKEYACNIHVGESQCTDTRVLKAVTDIMQGCSGDISVLSTCCLVLQRLLASQPCFEAVKSIPEIASVLFECMHSGNALLTYLATVTIRGAIKLTFEPGSIDIIQCSKAELGNKLVLLSFDNMQQMMTLLRTFTLATDTVLQVYGILELLSLALGSHSSEIDLGKAWLKAFESCVVGAMEILCTIFRSSSSVVFRSNSLLLKSILKIASRRVSSHMQKVCLGRCVVLIHLKNAIFSLDEETRLLSGNLVYLMTEGNGESQLLLEAFLPRGVMDLYTAKVSEMSFLVKDKASSRLSAWMKTFEILRKDTIRTPLLMWNDLKRMELKKFLLSEVQAFDEAATGKQQVMYNCADVQLVYSPESEGQGSIIGGVHLEQLIKHPPSDCPYPYLWKLRDPLSTFQSVFEAMVLGFTPLFGNNNLPEVDLRLAAHVLTWIYEQHTKEVQLCLETLNVIEIIVGMLREVIESEHQVFVFKLAVFLLGCVEIGGRQCALRFLRAGGATVLVPLVVLSLAKCCRDTHSFECDAWNTKADRFQSRNETVQVRCADGQIKTIRIPSGRSCEVLDMAIQDGSLDAKEAISWQDDTLHEKIQLGLALDILEAILRLSGSESNIEHFPPSSACFNLSREELLCHLVQILLRAKRPVFGRILDILSYIVKMNTDAMKRLYKLGAFEILLWKLLAGDVVESDRTNIVTFIRLSHLLQDVDSVCNGKEILKAEQHSTWQGSILRLYMPEGLILKLISEGPETFATTVDTENDTPEVIWNAEMRKQLVDYLVNELEPYVKFRAADPLALYIHIPKAPLCYPELADSVFSAPFYLQNLLDTERFPNYRINDPVAFLNSLMEDLQKHSMALINSGTPTSSSSFWMKEMPHIHLLLRAQAYLLERFPELLLPHEVESVAITLATPALRACMAQKDDSNPVQIDIVQQATVVLKQYCSSKAMEAELPQASLNFALNVLSLGTSFMEDRILPESCNSSYIESAVAGALLVLSSICSSRAGKDLIQDDIRWRKGFWWALCSAAEDTIASPARGPSPIAFAALNCMKYLAEDDQYCDKILNQAWYLPLLLLAIPTNSALKAQQSMSAILYSAADVLGSLVRTLQRSGTHSPPSKQHVHYILSMLIPIPVLVCLEQADGPERFINFSFSEMIHPMAIWTVDVRTELRLRVHNRLQEHQSALVMGNALPEDELEWIQRFQYECLRGEVVVEGMYVRGLAGGFWEGFNLPTGSSFLDALQDFLEDHQSYLITPCNETETGNMSWHEDQMQQSITTSENCEIEEILHVLAALRECLKFATKVGREDLILHVRYSLLSKICLAADCQPKVEMEIASIVKLLAVHELGRKQLLESELMQAISAQIWRTAAESSKSQKYQVLMATLEAALLLSENIAATVSAMNYFAACGILLPLLALFSKVELPTLSREGTTEAVAAQSGQIPHASQLLAAQILGQLLLAGSGISRRTKLLKDLAFRTVRNGTALLHTASTEGIEEATDMSKLLNIVELGDQSEEPFVIRTLLLLFPVDFLSTLARDPSKACDIFEGHHWSPRLVWDDGTRLCLKNKLTEEIKKVRNLIVNKGMPGLPSWYLVQGKPVFLRWALATVVDNEHRPLYRDTENEDYAKELYLSGFYIDQFLRNPEFDFGIALEEKFLREVRKAVVIGAPTEGINSDEFNFDDKRRLLLALLLLFKLRPSLLSRHSNIDIFLPVYEFISGGSGGEWRGLVQIAILLFHCTTTHSDAADCMSSEELMNTLSTLLSLNVPASHAGFAGSDPRLCTLMLILRLARLSSTCVELALQLGIVSKLAILVSNDDDTMLSHQAAECLAVMCGDKRRGTEVSILLRNLIPPNASGYASWTVPLADIRDEVIDSRTIKHFLQHRNPSSWWI